ncbi:MAG: glutamine amidotransferase family protein [Chloroflexi bacterium]|nr:glutamine amidotransferase family protein [Chloroflexota bacterium]
MKDLALIQNPHRDDKVMDACGLFGIMDTSGKRFSGADILKAMTNMHDRGNGLGGGFAAYGIYPDHAEYYALHIIFMTPAARRETEDFLKHSFYRVHDEDVPTRPTKGIVNPPQLRRYFVDVGEHRPADVVDNDYVVERVMEINARIDGAFVFSSGKNMGVFKGVGFPEDIGNYFRLEEYQGYLWTGHSRFPTNTPGWWGGAHPFNILDWTVVHNGEISSYGINRRYLEQFGYKCTMQTDTEVVAYGVDLLIRRHGLPIEVVAKVFAPPFWSQIERAPKADQELFRTLRQVYPSLLLNGPFTVIIAHQGEMIGLTDRIRLRPLTVGVKGSIVYLASEEAPIRLVCPDVEKTWIPNGGEPVVGRLSTAPGPQLPTPTRRGILVEVAP